jgi:hypothetical protein
MLEGATGRADLAHVGQPLGLVPVLGLHVHEDPVHVHLYAGEAHRSRDAEPVMGLDRGHEGAVAR